MSFTTVVWTMGASACLTLAMIHLLIGLRERAAANLVFAATAISAAAVAAFELLAMRSPLPETHGELVRWAHVPFLILLVCLVVFVRTYLKAGILWLGGAAIAMRVLALIVNFLAHPNLNYQRMTPPFPLRLLGETIYVTQGVPSARMFLGQASFLLLLLFLGSAAVTTWRRGERRRAARVIGGSSLFILGASVHTALVMTGVVRSPFVISLSYLGIVLVMAYDLTYDVVRASELARRLQRSQVALRESEQRTALAAEAGSVGFWILDPSTDALWVSGPARALNGHRGDEPIDLERFYLSIHPEDRDRVRADVETAIRTGGSFEREHRIVSPDGETRWIVMRGRVEPDPEGRPRMLGVSADVTPRKLAQLEAERLRSDLAHLSRVTTLGQLTSSLAHELNQPLAAILLNAESARRLLPGASSDPAEMAEILGDIVGDGRRASDIIARLRVLVRNQPVARVELDLGVALADVAKLAQSDALLRGCRVRLEVPAGLPTVRADRVHVQQVVLNLLLNAFEAMKDCPQEDREAVVRAVADGAFVTTSVSDRGKGLDEGLLERVFEPFYTTKKEGLGIGLAISRSLVEAHGGRLWAERNEGQGTTFRFGLPVA